MRHVLVRALVATALGAATVLVGVGPASSAQDDAAVPPSTTSTPARPAPGRLADRSVGVAPTAVSPECARTVLRYGSRGYCVTELQFNLNILFGLGLSMDGSYGPATTSAVYWFQRRYGLTYDGITGPQTWSTIAWCLDRARKGLPY